MNKFQKTLIGMVIALLAINIVLLVVLWNGRPLHQQNHRPKRAIITGPMLHRTLQLTPKQKNAFRKELKSHKEKMDTLHMAVRRKKHQVNKAIIQGDTSLLHSANQELFAAQIQLEQETQKLTAQLAELCDEQQKERFLKAMEKALRHNRH